MSESKALFTEIEKSIQTMIGQVILESRSGFPREKSNLYLRGEGSEILWSAEKPEPKALYARVKLNNDGKSLSAYASTGQACEIELKSGKLLNQTIIK